MKENGRPSKFEQVKDMLYKMASYGMTDKQMADVVGVSEQTVNNWKLKDPNFLESLKAEKEIADARVERSLFERATGYSHAEDKIFNDNGTSLVVPTVKHYAPDTTAAIFWLKNRKPKEWRDKQDIEHSGEVSQVVIVDDISKLK